MAKSKEASKNMVLLNGNLIPAHMYVSSIKHADELSEYMRNPRGCLSCFKFVTVRLIVWRPPRYKARYKTLSYRNSYYSPLCS